MKKDMMKAISSDEMENIYGGINLGAVCDVLSNAANVCGGVILGNPAGIVAGCISTGFHIGKIFDD